MAETTFATTQTPPGTPPSLLALDRSALAQGKVKISDDVDRARICVSSGKTIAGCQVRIVDENRQDIGETTIGEIAIRSRSMFDGYRNYPEKTAEVLCDGWYYSGDYGFASGGDYYVIGRKKDIIIMAGNNIYPEDVAVIAESGITEDQKQRKLKMDIIEAAMAIDVSITNVYLVPPRWLIKSSAGKPSRKANKE